MGGREERRVTWRYLTPLVGKSASFQQQATSSYANPVNVSNQSSNNDSSIMLLSMLSNQSEIVGSVGPPRCVRDPFLPDPVFEAISSLTNGYRWPRSSEPGSIADRMRTAQSLRLNKR